MSRLLAYRFPPGTAREGRLLGALERVFGGSPVRVLDLLFVGRDAETGELVALTVRGRGEGSLVSSLIGFRLDAAERRRATERALRTYEGDGEANAVRGLAEALPPGGAIAALLVEADRADALDEAMRLHDGALLLSESVPATELPGLGARLVAAAKG